MARLKSIKCLFLVHCGKIHSTKHPFHKSFPVKAEDYVYLREKAHSARIKAQSGYSDGGWKTVPFRSGDNYRRRVVVGSDCDDRNSGEENLSGNPLR